MDLQQEIARRRTFAIISHPDAGKTTLTEKLLLFGGAILLLSSLLSKFISTGAMLPVGIITSIVGVPFLFVLLLKNRRDY